MDGRRALALALLLAAASLAGCAAGDPDLGPPRPIAREPLEPASAPPAPDDGALRGAFVIGDAFVVADARISVAARDAPATDAVELAVAGARGATALARDHWTLVVDVEEAAPARVLRGEYRASLAWNGLDRGAIAIAQRESANATERATLEFDLGSSLDPSSAYVLAITPVTTETPPVERALATASDLTWREAAATNPTIDVPVGATLRITARNADGVFHNLAIADAAGRVLAGPTPSLAAEGDEATLAWTPPGPGRFAYLCQVHPAMKGAIDVA